MKETIQNADLIKSAEISNKSILLKVKKLDERAVIPTYKHQGDVGMDLTAIDVEYDRDSDMYIYHTGLAFESDMNIGQFIFPRSSNRRTDAYMCNHVAIVDSAVYRGEVIICYKNRDSIKSMIDTAYLKTFNSNLAENIASGLDLKLSVELSTKKAMEVSEEIENAAKSLKFAPYKVGERIAQMVMLIHPTVVMTETDTLTETSRGEGGFGSTGK